MRKWISNVVLVIAIGVFCYSGYQLFQIFGEYNKGTSEYEALKESVIQITIPEATEKEEEEKEVFQVDFGLLEQINKQVVGWIRFEEPEQISYPIVQAKDNEKYLHTTFEGKQNSSGAIFVDMSNARDFTDRNTFIYGHNMKNGSMFAKLREYRSAEFYKANPYFYIYTPDGRELTYEIFSVSIVEDSSESYRKWYDSDEDFQSYIKYIRSVARYQTNVEVTAQSKIVSLSTCTNVSDTERLLVHAVLKE